MKLARLLAPAVLLLLVCAPAGNAKSLYDPPVLSFSGFFVVDESIPGFRAPAEITVPAGTVKFTVANPKTATGKHGVGIDGGAYQDVNGMPVLPGRSTSLTIALAAGHTYTMYDSFSKNRDAGYAVKVKVVRKVRDTRRGKSCKEMYFSEDVRVLHRSCRGAVKLASRSYSAWEDAEYPSTVTVRGYVCAFDPLTPTGLRATCTRGQKRITYTP